MVTILQEVTTAIVITTSGVCMRHIYWLLTETSSASAIRIHSPYHRRHRLVST